VTPKKNEPVKVPHDLSEAMQKWYVHVIKNYILDRHHELILEEACRANDRAAEAREILKREGLAVRDKYGQIKPHPCAAIERQSQIIFIRALRELRLDEGETEEYSRPPRNR